MSMYGWTGQREIKLAYMTDFWEVL
jgi:hypothetical protein